MHDNNDKEVGYGKPPKSGQFKKGTSGNPKGRPKGSQNFVTLFWKVMNEKVTVKKGGKEVKMTVMELSLEQMARQASSGNARARADVIRLIEMWPADQRDIKDLPFDPDVRKQIVRQFVDRNKETERELWDRRVEQERPINVIP